MTERELFEAALELPADLRAAFLDGVCAGNAALRQRLESLLRQHEQVGSFLETPVLAAALPATLQEPAAEPPAAAAGQLLAGRYQLLQALGEGGMGTVWLAQQTEPVRRQVAVKLIKAGLDSQQVITRFEAERQALALMDHPNIAKVLDAGTTEGEPGGVSAGRPFFVMELVQGVPITRYCDEHRLTPRQRLELFAPVCQAIQHAHQKGIIHRDIKPSNVLVTEYDGRAVVKVIDFGVAKATGQQLSEQTLHTGLGAVVGTLEYMSPEQAGFNQLDVDTRSDIYSLGVLLYELLAGSPPFSRQELAQAGVLEMLRVIREQEPSRPSTRLSTADGLPTLAANRGTEPAKLTKLVRGELDWIVMKALEKDRSRRYETANAFATDVQRYLADEPVLACPPSAGYRLKKFLRRNKGPVLAASLVLAVLLLGVAVSTWQAVRATLAEAEAIAERNDKEAARQTVVKERDRAEASAAQALRAAQAESHAKQAALNAADKERQARALSDKRLQQIEKANWVLLSVFLDLDPHLERKQGTPLRAQLAARLAGAEKLLNAEAVPDELMLGRLQVALGRSYLGLGYTKEAADLFLKAQKTFAAVLPPDHQQILTTINNLATAYQSAGQYDLALPLYEQVFQKHLAQRGPDDPETLTVMNNLAAAYTHVRQFDRGVKLLEEVVRKRTQLLGPDHPNTLTAVGNLACAYRDLGRFQPACGLLEDQLTRSRRVLGPDHVETLTCMANLAQIYAAAGKLDLAVPLFEQTLAERQAKLGSDHPDTLASMSTLGNAYADVGKLDRAIPLLEQTLEKHRAKFGRKDEDTLTAMNRLADAYRQTGKLTQAVALLEECLAARRARFGLDHPDTLHSMCSLGLAYQTAGEVARAVPLLEETLARTKALFGPDHPDTLASMVGLAVAYQFAGNLQDALPLYEQALAKMKTTLGAEHHKTLATMNNLATAYLVLRKFDQALPLLEEAVDKLKTRLGLDHYLTWSALANLGIAADKTGNPELAVRLLAEALARRKGALGADHLDTLTTQFHLAVVYQKTGKLKEAIPLFEETLQKHRAAQPDHPHLFKILQGLGLAYHTSGQLARAVPHLEEAVKLMKVQLGPGHEDTLITQALLATDYIQLQRPAAAEPHLDEWLQQQRPKLPADQGDVEFMLRLFGECRVALKKFAEAEAPLRETLATYHKKKPNTLLRYHVESVLGAALAGQHKDTEAEPFLLGSARSLLANHGKWSGPGTAYQSQVTVAALERVVAFYDARGRKEEAAQWRKHLDALRPAKK